MQYWIVLLTVAALFGYQDLDQARAMLRKTDFIHKNWHYSKAGNIIENFKNFQLPIVCLDELQYIMDSRRSMSGTTIKLGELWDLFGDQNLITIGLAQHRSNIDKRMSNRSNITMIIDEYRGKASMLCVDRGNSISQTSFGLDIFSEKGKEWLGESRKTRHSTLKARGSWICSVQWPDIEGDPLFKEIKQLKRQAQQEFWVKTSTKKVEE